MINRLRIYFNYGAVGFLLTLLILYALDEIIMFIIPMIFNLALWKKLKKTQSSKTGLIIGILSGLITTLIFVVQMNYKNASDFACIKLIPNSEKNTNYAYTMILFSVVIWELGIGIWNKKLKQIG
jgi:hypothetical protein